MDTFWLKIAAAAVGLVVAIVLVSVLISGGPPKPQTPEKTFYDTSVGTVQEAEDLLQWFVRNP